MDPERTRHAQRLFAGIAPEYDRMGAVLSFGQDPRWRRFLASKVNAIPGAWVLDVATGTGLVARELARRNVRVVGLDQSRAMVERGKLAVEARGMQERIRFVLGQAQSLPFPDEAFDAVTFTYLLRYVEDPKATVAELARVLRPGGVMASLEFHVPPESWTRAGWVAYTSTLVPAVSWVASPAWSRTARFLPRSIAEFVRRYPLPVQVRWWQEAGMRRVRTKLLSNGAAVVTWAVKSTPVLEASEPRTS
ncbi:MAG TPA: class I SAM-dependent methyltransferase [Actinomycetota bacterium]|jgi:demethylmenaquinone methyltransferase/2-methoxy-6-polyprenyl-1,4-benzoquinol methylase